MNKYPKKDLKLHVWKFKKILLFQLQSHLCLGRGSWFPLRCLFSGLRRTILWEVCRLLLYVQDIFTEVMGSCYQFDNAKPDWAIRQVKALPCDRLVLLGNGVQREVSRPVRSALHRTEVMPVLGWLLFVFTHSLVWILPSVLPSPSAGAHWVTTGTLKCQAAPARGVTVARTALSTATVTAGPGSASAGRGPRGSAVGTVNRGTFWWKATVCVSVTPPKG